MGRRSKRFLIGLAMLSALGTESFGRRNRNSGQSLNYKKVYGEEVVFDGKDYRLILKGNPEWSQGTQEFRVEHEMIMQGDIDELLRSLNHEANHTFEYGTPPDPFSVNDAYDPLKENTFDTSIPYVPVEAEAEGKVLQGKLEDVPYLNLRPMREVN